MVAAALTVVALALPQHALVVPGRSFGGLRLGARSAQVRSAWGRRFGRCDDCVAPTWYFTYRRFQPQGAGVSFRTGRADAFFTLWSPAGWHTNRGLTIGDPQARVSDLYGPIPLTACGSYSVLVLRLGRTDTQFYLYDHKLWGFGLSRAGAQPCR